MPTLVPNTIAATLNRATQKLNMLASPRLEAEALLAYLLNKDRSYLRGWPDKELTEQQQAQFTLLVERRYQNEPLAYITGQREFWSLTLNVTPATLIPRPETELLVEKALDHIPVESSWRIADLGTGSGAIALALASERRNCQLFATDISSAALKVATGNAQRLNLHNIHLCQGSWCEALPPLLFHMIVSNPPYIGENDPHLLEEGLLFEPHAALSPGGDSLAAIRTIIQQTKKLLCSPGWLLLEHGFDQGEAVRRLLSHCDYSGITTYQDLAGHERLTMAQHQHNAAAK